MSDSCAVLIQFKNTGDAPILKNTKVKIDSDKRFAEIVNFLRKQIDKQDKTPVVSNVESVGTY
jgi:hypothetical protein